MMTAAAVTNRPRTRTGEVSRPRRRRRSGYSTVRAVLLVVVTLGALLPLAWMVVASFESNAHIRSADALTSYSFSLDNYRSVFGAANYGKYVVNSLVVALGATVVSLLLGVPAAYAMARFMMKNSTMLVLLARIVPAISLLVPWYYVFARLHLTGSYAILIIANIFVLLPLCVYIMTSFFDSVPIELEEAGLVDGLTHIQTFTRVVLPLSTGGVATAGILSFIFAWNNFMFPLVLSDSGTKTLPVAVFDFVSYARVDWGSIMAATAIMTLPIVVIALFAQRYIVAGITVGASKG